MTAEKYQPNPSEIVEGYSMMTPEQKEQSAIREIFIESEHRVAELPEDFQYEPMRTVSATGQMRGELAGTFEDKTVRIQKYSWDEGKTWKYSGKTAGNEELTDEESQSLWERIYPAAEVYDKMQNTQAEQVQQLQSANEATRRSHESAIGQARNQARKEGFVEGEESGKIKGILENRLKEVEASDEDREFLESIIERVAQFYGTENQKTEREQRLEKILGQYLDIMVRQKDNSELDTYNRRRELLLKIFGASEPQTWVAGFGTEYVHSSVYPTIIPELIVREGYDRKELPSTADAMIAIERKSRFQKDRAPEAA